LAPHPPTREPSLTVGLHADTLPDLSALPRHDPYAALREPNYRFFAGGWVLASMGLQMQGTAIAWEVYEKTHDPLALGFVGLARALPVLALALPAGAIVDLLDRKRILIGTQIAFAAASLALTMGSYHNLTVWWIFALVALTGCARVFNGPSRSSLLPQIVRPETFHNAVTWNSGVFQLSAVLGPIAAGAMIAITHSAWPVYAVAGGSCLVFAVFCTFIRPYYGERERVKGSIFAAARPSVLLPGMFEGVRHVWRDKPLFGALTLDLMAVLLGGATALMPVYAKDILHVGPVGLGALKSAPFAGALVMALLLAHRRPFERAGRTLLLSVAGFGACTIAFGFSKLFWLSLAMLSLLGALDSISVVIRHVLVSVRTPDRLRGRVSAVNSVFIESSNELGGFESGALAKAAGVVLASEVKGAVFSAVSGGFGTILVVVGMAWWLPQLRRLGRLELPKPGGVCERCGYDLTGNTTGICPECGARIPEVEEAVEQREETRASV